MTDRGQSALRQSRDTFEVGPSALRWQNGALTIDINEISSLPLVSRLRGQITVTPSGLSEVELPLTPDGAHIWRPFAPTAEIKVEIDRPGWTWSGHGYFDANFGTRALEADFNYWTWGRFPLRHGSVCFYDAIRRDGSHLSAGYHFSDKGAATEIALPPQAALPRSPWTVRRITRADPGFRPHQVKPMLDAPFYNRAMVRTKVAGEETVGVYEALDLNRFRGPWLMPMLAVRVPRRANWQFDDAP